MPHDEFEIAIESRLHEALSPHESIALAEHLSACESCRDYDARARSENLGLASLFARQESRVDLRSAQASADRALRRARQMRYVWPLLAVGFFALQLGVTAWARASTPSAGRVLIHALFAALAAMGASALARETSTASEARLAHIGALHFYRQTILTSIRTSKRLLCMGPVLAALIAGVAACVWDRETRLVVEIFVPLLLAATGWTYFVRLPRLRRESHELS